MKSLGIKDLYETVGWVAFKYPDESVRVFRTTLNEEMLRPVLKDKEGDQLYDLDKRKWVSLPDDPEVSVSITDECPDIGKVMQFVNRFV